MITTQAIRVLKGHKDLESLSSVVGLTVLSESSTEDFDYAIVRITLDDADTESNGFDNVSALSEWEYITSEEAADIFTSGNTDILATMMKAYAQNSGLGLN